ncbi:hypothetical protein GmHk_14G041695 [Glycine max]|nr:hypothetical protein GmHk_14G041695 [Glycine max]
MVVGSYGRPSFIAKNKHAFPPYGLPPNYTPSNVAYTPNENVNNSTPILIESQQPQFDHAHVSQPIGETHEMPHHNLAEFEPCLGYATEGQAAGDIPLQNTLEGPQYHPQPHPLHSTPGKNPHAMAEMGEWRDLAAQVAPPMTKREMIIVIVDTVPVFYYEKMVRYTPSSFADLVFADEKIKVGMERGKSDHPALMNAKTGANEEGENEGETHVATAVPTWKIPHQLNNIISQPISALLITHHPIIHKDSPQISVSYANLLPYLLDNAMVAITSSRFPQPPFLRGYDSNATCAYHGGAPGHSIEHCRALKHKVQGLIDAGWLKFEENCV